MKIDMRKKHMKTSIWWIRRDIRLNHNPTLVEAINQSTHILPLFILDPHLFERKADRRTNFLFQALDSLDKELQKKGSRLMIQSGDPLSILQQVVSSTQAEMIFAEEDYSPYAHKRDLAVAGELPLWLVHGLTVFPPGMVVKSSGCPYTIYTPYKKAWYSLPQPQRPSLFELPNFLPPLPECKLENIPLPEFQPEDDFPATESAAHSRLDQFLSGPVFTYKENRDRMDLDGTSRLSPYLRFGLISIQYVVGKVNQLKGISTHSTELDGLNTWMDELIWREFYISILHHFPEVLQGSFRKDLRNIHWRNKAEEFAAWQKGCTGYPIVDAGIKQLLQTGWMHNRARMITASFLVKDLLVDWQKGESWFMEQLIDGDPAANNGGWQWTSGVGTDAAPYFRIFNPVLQGLKFDPSGDYVRKWVPELKNVPLEYIHKPWTIPTQLQKKLGIQIGIDYPLPIIDHQAVRKQILAAYATDKTRSPVGGCR
jgi:deoxyribodipyrimidine photo-lyase